MYFSFLPKKLFVVLGWILIISIASPIFAQSNAVQISDNHRVPDLPDLKDVATIKHPHGLYSLSGSDSPLEDSRQSAGIQKIIISTQEVDFDDFWKHIGLLTNASHGSRQAYMDRDLKGFVTDPKSNKILAQVNDTIVSENQDMLEIWLYIDREKIKELPFQVKVIFTNGVELYMTPVNIE